CDPPVGGHSCNGGMIPRFHCAVCDNLTLGGQLKTYGNSPCCARAASGHTQAAPPSSVMNERRFMSSIGDFLPMAISAADWPVPSLPQLQPAAGPPASPWGRPEMF